MSNHIQVHGQISVLLRSQSGAQVKSTAYVVEGHQVEPLLGDADAKALGILQIRHDGGAAETIAGITTSLRGAGITLATQKAPMAQVPEAEREQVQQLVDRHKKAFDGVGLLKNREARFHIDTSVPPTSAPYRPVPLAYQGRLSKHLDELRSTDKIEDVDPEEESPWTSNVVITEKKSQGQIRMNVDMRAANKAISPHKRHIITVQEMRHQLRGATRFSEMDITMSLDTNSAMGPDGIHPAVLKYCAPTLLYPLHTIFSRSLAEGEVPMAWKCSTVIPIFKKGHRYEPLNYRPVSLTPVCCKVLEHIIANHLRAYLDDNALLSHHQFGFRQGRSTMDQLLLVYDEIASSVDAGSTGSYTF